MMKTQKKRHCVERWSAFVSLFVIVGILAVIGMNNSALADTGAIQHTGRTQRQKVLYVASYSIEPGNWSFQIQSGIESVLESRNSVQFKAISMDTMGLAATETAQKEQAALEVKKLIDAWKPDLVIASDDNASKYLIVPYFKGSDLPFVFCGVNWDASTYGFPAKNVTGMLEVQLVDQLIAYLAPYAKGQRIGSLRADTMTNRTEAEHFTVQAGVDIRTYFVDNIPDWKTRFVQLQDEVDMILLGDLNSVKTWGDTSKSDVTQFMVEHTKVPTGRWDAEYKNDALITVGTIPREQGEYAGQTALKILDGTSPQDLPLVKNKKAKFVLNMKLAKKLGIIFPMELIESAELIPAD